CPPEVAARQHQLVQSGEVRILRKQTVQVNKTVPPACFGNREKGGYMSPEIELHGQAGHFKEPVKIRGDQPELVSPVLGKRQQGFVGRQGIGLLRVWPEYPCYCLPERM